jgi:hypothetical protein
VKSIRSTWSFLLLSTIAAVAAPLRAAQHDSAATANVKTFGTVGKELSVLKPGKEAELFHRDGAGCLTHMWFGGDWPGYLRTHIRVYVDGEATPSIDMEIGLGIGIGFEDPAAPWGIARMGKTGQPSGDYNTFRIPFGNGVRVTAQLADDVKQEPVFWWIVRGSENLPVSVGGVRLPPTARLKLQVLRDYKANILEEFNLCDTKSQGMLYLVTIAARSEQNFNFLEAQMRAYIDGAAEPLMLSSGLEDYFLGTYYFNRGRYYTPIAGLTHIDNNDFSFSGYRFHDDDPVAFAKGLRLTCRCGETSGDKVFGGNRGNPRPTVYTTYTWIYEW